MIKLLGEPDRVITHKLGKTLYWFSRDTIEGGSPARYISMHISKNPKHVTFLILYDHKEDKHLILGKDRSRNRWRKTIRTAQDFIQGLEIL